MKEGPTMFMKTKDRETGFSEGPTILMKTRQLIVREPTILMIRRRLSDLSFAVLGHQSSED